MSDRSEVIAGRTPFSGKRQTPWAVRSIVCFKIDHIGDMLIAVPALAALRLSFPNAHITIICAPWNRGLVERLGVADRICTLTLFAQSALTDEGAMDRHERERAAAAELLGLGLPPCDLAVDMRRDEDTRFLLKLVTASVYAGFGDIDIFPFLDVALPFIRHGDASGASSLVLGPRDLLDGEHRQIDHHGVRLVSRSGVIEVAIATDSVWPPSNDGEEDTRPLGAALWAVSMLPHRADGDDRPIRPVPVIPENLNFGPGWLPWESWGRWSTIETAGFDLTVGAEAPTVRLLLQVQGHTSISHPDATVKVSAGGACVDHQFHAGDGPVNLEVTASVKFNERTRLRSAPYLMRGGRYRGSIDVFVDDAEAWEPLILTIRGAHLPQALAVLKLPDEVAAGGKLSFPFDIEIKDTGEPVIIEVASARPDRAGGTAVAGIRLDWLQGRAPTLPLVHMEQQLLDLAAMVATRFSREPRLGGYDAIARRLGAPRPGSSAAAAIAMLDRLASAACGPRPRRLIGVALGANKAVKLWPLPFFVDLAQRLLGIPDVTLVVIGGPGEREVAAEFTTALAAAQRVVDLTACCRIEDLGEVLSRLHGFIGLDTGTTHFAGRLGVRTLAVFGASHDPVEWGPVGEHSHWATAPLDCGGCSLTSIDQCRFALRCMTQIDPDTVWRSVREVILEDEADFRTDRDKPAPGGIEKSMAIP